LCPNPGPITLDGTNTWVLLEPGATEATVIDPGPLDESHLRAVVAAVDARGARVSQTILTHGHADHAEGAELFAGLTGAPTRAVGRGHDDLGDGDVLRAGARGSSRCGRRSRTGRAACRTWWSGSTPTCRARCGPLRRCRWPRSWTTC